MRPTSDDSNPLTDVFEIGRINGTATVKGSNGYLKQHPVTYGQLMTHVTKKNWRDMLAELMLPHVASSTHHRNYRKYYENFLNIFPI